jgi:hypothetical protein
MNRMPVAHQRGGPLLINHAPVPPTPRNILPPREETTIEGNPAVQLNRYFHIQSYCDSTALENGLVAQQNISRMIASTINVEQVRGWSVALAPWSECPVAVQFGLGRRGGQNSASNGVILAPGQAISPTGLPPGKGKGGQFDSIRFGLPFGWLGGGQATLFVLKTPDAEVSFAGLRELMFHQFRIPLVAVNPVQAGADMPAIRYNWPTRFPWPLAISYQQASPNAKVPQGGQPVMAVRQTRLVFRLLTDANTVGSPISVRAVVRGADDLDINSTGTTVATAIGTNSIYSEFQFPANAYGPGYGLPTVVLDDGYAVVEEGATAGGLSLITTTPLAGTTYVDVLRLGILG